MPDAKVVQIEQVANALVVRVSPEGLDEKNLSQMRSATSAAGAESPNLAVVLDLSKVSYLPSLSIGGLVQLTREFKSRNQRFVLTGLQPNVRETISLTRLDRLFEIVDDLTSL